MPLALAALPSFTWDIDPVFVHLGPLAIRYYSLLYVLVFLGGYKLLDWQIRRAGGSQEDASDFVIYGVIAVLAGSRLGHVLFYDLDKALKDPLWVLQIWKGGLASHGGTIGLMIAMWLFTKKRGQSFVEGSDRFSFSAALGATLIRAGNWFNSEIVGRVTDGTWGVRFPRYDRVAEPPLRHPSQLYEFFFGAFVMLALWIADRALGKEKRPRGFLISLFFALYFSGRFFLEYFKEYQSGEAPEASVGILDFSQPLSTGQLLSIVPALLGFLGLLWSYDRKVPAKWNVPESEEGDDDDEGDEGDDEGDDDEGDPDVDDVLDESDEEKERRKKAALAEDLGEKKD